jgi:hypothetical protein
MMLRGLCQVSCALVAISALSFPETDRAQTELPKLIAALSGTWSTHDTVASDGKTPQVGNGVGEGEEIFRPGPGSHSLVEEYHSLGPDAACGLGIFWPVPDGKTFQVFWCDSAEANSCRILNGPAEWKDNQLTIHDERSENGKTILFREVFAFDTPNSFSQTLSNAEPGGSFKTFLIVRATRKNR